jgi:hypothetical protein
MVILLRTDAGSQIILMFFAIFLLTDGYNRIYTSSIVDFCYIAVRLDFWRVCAVR